MTNDNPKEPAATTTSNWWTNVYDDLLAEVLLVRADRAELEATMRFLIRELALKPGDRVFDQCCGIGSIAIELAALGLNVVGVEQAAKYVERGLVDAKAREATSAKNDAKTKTEKSAGAVAGAVDLIAGDAREFVPRERVQGAFNWWTSFGYSPDDRDNARMLDRAFDSLEVGGVFLLDTMNLPGVLRHFQEETTTRRATKRGEITLVRRTRIDAHAGVMRKRWSYVLPDGQLVEKEESVVRLYMPHTLVTMFEAAGFEDVSLIGSIRGEPLQLDSERCIVKGRRKKQRIQETTTTVERAETAAEEAEHEAVAP